MDAEKSEMSDVQIEKALRLATSRQLAAALSAKRETFAGGRPRVQRKCKKCGKRFGAREMRAHKCQV